ncbi:MAG: hypothetical protein DMG65_22310 [Candidatus Angelobacter sp. Gp1-AA117]|nr:MAG: hypothetical protein DMG65_22310 [Candidatus Angelobacter sp. Gp1-AA117]
MAFARKSAPKIGVAVYDRQQSIRQNEAEHGTNDANSFGCKRIACSGCRFMFRYTSGTDFPAMAVQIHFHNLDDIRSPHLLGVTTATGPQDLCGPLAV